MRTENRPGSAQLALDPAMPGSGQPEWAGARWVGAIDSNALPRTGLLRLNNSEGYQHARLLVRDGTVVRGFVDVRVDGGLVAAADLAVRIDALPHPRHVPVPGALPSITVVVCTRNRAVMLRSCLLALLDLDYPTFDVVVVDNASSTRETWNMLATEFADRRVTAVEEPQPGLSRARNTGLKRATGEIVAFTDDDVVVDRFWLREIAAAYTLSADVDCVTGLVPSGELRTRVQGYFDDRVTWSKSVVPRTFSMGAPPADLPTFPFCVGEYGTGANLTFRRSALIAIGGFDHALGVGTPTGGGEDLDIFTRILLAGRTLVVQPSAIVWHRHRDDIAELRIQARGYGTGLGAWVTKLLLDRKTLPLIAARSPRALARLVTLGRRPADSVTPSDGPKDDFDRLVARVGRSEIAAVARGPLLYLRQRWAGIEAEPLRKKAHV